jgi:hypothetical protein
MLDQIQIKALFIFIVIKKSPLDIPAFWAIIAAEAL